MEDNTIDAVVGEQSIVCPICKGSYLPKNKNRHEKTELHVRCVEILNENEVKTKQLLEEIENQKKKYETLQAKFDVFKISFDDISKQHKQLSKDCKKLTSEKKKLLKIVPNV
jgi:DNA repair exonuclease SbcCD ATPase subunit